MNTRQKIMGLAALPLAGLLATGGVAMAQTAGTPAGTQVVRQAVTHRAGDPCPEHAAKVAAQHAAKPCPQHAVKTAAKPAAKPCPQHAVTVAVQPARQQVRDRDCGPCRDGHQAQAVKTASTVAHPRHGGTCEDHADR